MKPGDLVTDRKRRRMGIVVEVFDDLDSSNPWIRVRWTVPYEGSEWCKGAGLEYASDPSGSLPT